MKKSYLAIIVSVLVLLTTIIWIGNAGMKFSYFELVQYFIIFMLVGFGLLAGIRRLKSEKRGQPAEDELSKKIMQKALALAYLISIYLWLGIMYFSDKIAAPLHTIIGGGILGMAVIFAVCWAYVYFFGMKNE